MSSVTTIIDRIEQIPAMTPRSVHEYLVELGREWAGRGVAVECGSWLGATCAALGVGLLEAAYDDAVYCFDRWEANREECEKAKQQGDQVDPKQNLEPLFLHYVSDICPDLHLDTTRIGRLRNATWNGCDIEIFMLDAAKSNPQFLSVMDEFGPSFLPGVTVVGLMDYYFARKKGRRRNQEQFIDNYEDSWTKIKDFDSASCAFFRYEGGIW